MAQRRMFSPDITESDAFLEMPEGSQNLYFHLGMYADDDGFVGPRKIMRLLGSKEDDVKVLVAKRFLLLFDNGIVVVKHWRINNLVRKDWYRPTQYVEQASQIFVKENGAYTLDPSQGRPLSSALVNESLPSRQHRIGKDRIGKDIEEESTPDKPERHLSYLKEIPDDDLKEFSYRFDASPKQIQSKAEDLLNWIESKGKTHTYKNYKAFLLNALKKDFKEMTDEERERRRILSERVKATMEAVVSPGSEVTTPVNPEAQSRLDEMRGGLAKRMTLPKRV